MKTGSGRLRRAFYDGCFSPVEMLALAAAIVLLYGILHVAGLREYTSVISGTFPEGASRSGLTVALGVAYAGANLGAVVAAPILALGALIFALIRLVFPEKS